MSNYTEVEKHAIKHDIVHSRTIFDFLKVKLAVDGGKTHLVRGYVGSDVYTLFSGMQISGETLQVLTTEAANSYGKSVPYLSLLVDKSLTGRPTRGIHNGYILTSSPDRPRTDVIKKWCYIELFEEDKHGSGFEQALVFISMFTAEHIRMYSLFSRILELEVPNNEIFNGVSSSRDWENIWKIYNRLVYGHEVKNEATLRLREACRAVGLDNKREFEKLTRRSNKPFLALSALAIVGSGFTR